MASYFYIGDDECPDLEAQLGELEAEPLTAVELQFSLQAQVVAAHHAPAVLLTFKQLRRQFSEATLDLTNQLQELREQLEEEKAQGFLKEELAAKNLQDLRAQLQKEKLVVTACSKKLASLSDELQLCRKQLTESARRLEFSQQRCCEAEAQLKEKLKELEVATQLEQLQSLGAEEPVTPTRRRGPQRLELTPPKVMRPAGLRGCGSCCGSKRAEELAATAARAADLEKELSMAKATRDRDLVELAFAMLKADKRRTLFFIHPDRNKDTGADAVTQLAADAHDRLELSRRRGH